MLAVVWTASRLAPNMPEKPLPSWSLSGECMRLVFMGTPDFSVAALAALIDAGHDIVCV